MKHALIAAVVCLGVAAAEPLSPMWRVVSGTWETLSDVRPFLVQRDRGGRAEVVRRELRDLPGVWRCRVQPSLGTERCGMRIALHEDMTKGWLCEVGGNPGVGGFALRGSDDTVLWEDRWAPWAPYDALTLECVVDQGRIRAQLLSFNGKTLISQSDWVTIGDSYPLTRSTAGVYTVSGVARFWDLEYASEPLLQVTDDAPNKRRLVQGEHSEWALFGTGNWMWTDGSRQRMRQYARTERAWAVNTGISGQDRLWQCRVRIAPGTGGAGMLFKSRRDATGGFNCWLGGTHGAGSLMLYRNGGPGRRGTALWASPQDRWHYDEDLVLRAETREGRVRVQLLEVDGGAIRAESPWIETTDQDDVKTGVLGFHTWKGPAEFWAFSEEMDEKTERQEVSAVTGPGPDWRVLGDGEWALADDGKRLEQIAGDAESTCLNIAISGAKGIWRCRIARPAGTPEAAFLFQANAALTEGFLCVLAADGVRLRDLGQKETVLWERTGDAVAGDSEIVFESLVQTDRLVVRVLSGDGEAVHVESPPIYVTDRNNTRNGCLGMRVTGGSATFSEWQFLPER